MRPPFRLNKTIGEAYDMDLADTLITKQTLASLGHLEVPDGGFDPYPDRPMIEAVKSFQRAEGLTEDGVMKPDGPTLARLNSALENASVPAPPNNRQDTSATSLLGPAPEPTSPLSRHLASLPARPGAVPPMDSRNPPLKALRSPWRQRSQPFSCRHWGPLHAPSLGKPLGRSSAARQRAPQAR